MEAARPNPRRADAARCYAPDHASSLPEPTFMPQQASLSAQLDALSLAHLPTIMSLIERVVQTRSPAGSTLGPMTQYHLSTGGKRLRALLPLAVAQALGHDPGALIPFGAACELLHNATLVHDDLQDGDTMRRGKETIWVKYGPERAINLGDAMLYLTLSLLDELPFSLEARHAVTQRLIRETLCVIDGQEREFLLKAIDRPTVQDYARMVEGKTSGLFSLPLVGAAQLCQQPSATLDALAAASMELGVVFQIQDDLLDLYGDKGRAQRGSDIAEGKISMLVVYALERADEASAQWLRALLRRGRAQVSQEEVEQAIALMESVGAPQAAFQEIDRRVERALGEPALAQHATLGPLVAQIAQVFLAPIQGVRQALDSP